MFNLKVILVGILGLAQAPFVSAANDDDCIKTLDTIYESEKRVVDDSKLRRYVLCPNTEYYIALNFANDGSPLDGQYPIPVGRPNIHVLCGEDGKSQNNCQLVRGLVHVGIVDEFGTESVASNVLLQGLTFFRATSVNVIAMTGGDIVIRDCVFKRNRNVASVYAVAPYSGLRHRSLKGLEDNPSHQLTNYLDARRRTTETTSFNMTKLNLHIQISDSVFSDNVVGASPGADTTAVIYSVGASMELSNSVIVGTTKDEQKIEKLPHLIYVEEASMMLHNNCFLGNDNDITPLVSQSSTIYAESNFNQRTSSNLPKSNCDFIARNQTGPEFVCEAADAMVCKATAPQNYRYPCVTYLDDIYFSEWDVRDSSVTRTYLLCADTTFRVGSRHDDNGTPMGGSYPIILGRSNIRVLCGADGKLENNCAVRDGVVQVAHFDEFDTNKAPIENAFVSGISFQEASAINVLVSGAGDVDFQDCVFKSNANVATVYVQAIKPRIRGQRKLRYVMEWIDEVVDPLNERSLAVTPELRANFDSCVFSDNIIGSAASAISGLISNHGANLTLSNSMIVNTVNQVSTEYVGYYEVGYLVGNFDGRMTLESNCFFHNEVSIAPVINQGVIKATSNAGYQAMVPQGLTPTSQLPEASSRLGNYAEQEAMNASNTNFLAYDQTRANNTDEPPIDTANARCEFIANVEDDVLGAINPELVSFSCEIFDSDICDRADAPSNAPSMMPTASPQPSVMPSPMPTALSPPTQPSGTVESVDISAGTKTSLGLSTLFVLSFFTLASVL